MAVVRLAERRRSLLYLVKQDQDERDHRRELVPSSERRKAGLGLNDTLCLKVSSSGRWQLFGARLILPEKRTGAKST